MGGGNEEVDFMPLFSIDENEESEEEEEEYSNILPILALKNTVLFPGVIIPVTVGRTKSINAVNEAYKTDKTIGILTQKEITIADPLMDDLYKTGVVAKVLKVLKMPDGTTTAILQGKKKLILKELIESEPFLRGSFDFLPLSPVDSTPQFIAIISAMREMAEKIIKISPNIPNDASLMLNNIKTPRFLINFIGSNLNSDVATKQQILEIVSTEEKADEVLKSMNHELQVLELKQKN
jgi:ATP-dependent Lon protease